MKTIVVPAQVDQMDAVNAFLDAELEAHDCPMKTQLKIELAAEEIFVNVAQYSGAAEAEISIDISGEPKSAVIVFSDSGVAFDPFAQPEADTTLPAEEREVGGLGIFLIRRTMDEATYRRSDGKNILTIRKSLNA